MKRRLTMTASFVNPRAGVVRTRLEPVAGLHQRVEDPVTTSPHALSTPTVVEHAEGMRVGYVELGSGPTTIASNALVRSSVPLHLRTRVPPITWDQGAALTRAIRTTGKPGDGTEVSPAEALRIACASLPSRLVQIDDEDRDLAFSTLNPGQPLIVAIAEIASKVAVAHEDSERATHALIGAMRSVGLAASYVIGVDPDGEIHPWAAVYVPGFAWFHIDPCTATPIDERDIVLGWGRDASDVPLVHEVEDLEVSATLTEL